LQVIGRITAATGISVVDQQGKPLMIAGAGWDHFG